MSIYESRYIGKEKQICSENHSSDEFKKCTDEIIDVLIRYEMNIEEANAVFRQIGEQLNPCHIFVSSIMKFNCIK